MEKANTGLINDMATEEADTRCVVRMYFLGGTFPWLLLPLTIVSLLATIAHGIPVPPSIPALEI